MLHIAVMVLALLCFGLTWVVFRLFSEREYDHELDTGVERAIYEAGWLVEYREAHRKAKGALAKRRDSPLGEPEACNE